MLHDTGIWREISARSVSDLNTLLDDSALNSIVGRTHSQEALPANSVVTLTKNATVENPLRIP